MKKEDEEDIQQIANQMAEEMGSAIDFLTERTINKHDVEKHDDFIDAVSMAVLSARPVVPFRTTNMRNTHQEEATLYANYPRRGEVIPKISRQVPEKMKFQNGIVIRKDKPTLEQAPVQSKMITRKLNLK